MVANAMKNHATATLDVAEVYTLQTGEETQLIPTNAPILGQMAAQRPLRRTAKCLIEAARVKDPCGEASVFCRPVGAAGNLFQTRELYSRTKTVHHESTDEQYGDYLDLKSFAHAPSHKKARQSAPPSHDLTQVSDRIRTDQA